MKLDLFSVEAPAHSPAAKTLAFGSPSRLGVDLRKVDLTEPIVVLPSDYEIDWVRFSPSGRILAAIPRVTFLPDREIPVYLWHAPSLE